MATTSQTPSLADFEVKLLQNIQVNPETTLAHTRPNPLHAHNLDVGEIYHVPRPRRICYSPDRSSEQPPISSRQFFPSRTQLTICYVAPQNPQDDIVIFSAPTAYFLVADPHFGLSLLVTLSLTELINGVVKLYCIRPRPLWVSTALRRKGSVWEKVRTRKASPDQGSSSHPRSVLFSVQDSSFPSSHSQTVATLASFLFLEGKDHLPYNVWFYASLVTGVLALLTGFSRAYLAMHFASDVRYSPCSLSSPFSARFAIFVDSNH